MQTQEQSQIDSGTLKRARARALVDYWQNNEAYKFYVPNGKAEEFIAAVGRDDTFISLFSAANGVGKTAVGANMLANIFWESPTEWFNYPIYKNFPYNKRGRIVSDHTTIKTTLIPELEKWFPKGRYKTDNMGKNYPYLWKTDTGFEFDLMTYDQSDKEFESANLGWIWFDEPPPESIYKASVARLRNGGVMFITATPLTGSAWMYDQIMTKPEVGQRQVIEADVWSNSISKGIRGRLTDRDIDRMIAEYSEEDKQARIFGKFQHLTGLVFKNFNRKIHVIRPFEITKQDFVVVERLDTHPRNPDACIWVAVDKNGTKFVCDELYMKGTTQELASNIKQKAFPLRLLDRKIDPSAFIEDQHTGKSLAGLLRSLGLDYLPASKRRAMTIERIRNALDYREAGDAQQGTQLIKRPELYVFDTCVRTIWEFEHWQYHEYSGKAEEYRGKSEKPQDKDDHMMESLGRALIDEPQFQIYKPEYFQQGSVEGQVLTLDPYN